MQYPHLLQCTATRWRFRFNKKGKAYAWWYKYFYATLWLSLECSKPDVVQARPGQARAGQERTGEARPCQSRSVQTKRQPLTLWPSIGISLLRVSHSAGVYMYAYVYMCVCVRSRASILPSCCSKSHNVDGHSLWFGRANTAHAAASLIFLFFFVPGKATLTSCHLMSHIHTYLHTYILCVWGMPSHISELISLSVPPLHGFFLLVTLEFFCVCLSCGSQELVDTALGYATFQISFADTHTRTYK